MIEAIRVVGIVMVVQAVIWGIAFFLFYMVEGRWPWCAKRR